MKTKEQKLIQVKRIMRKLEKRGRNCKKINDVYRDLIKLDSIDPTKEFFIVVSVSQPNI